MRRNLFLGALALTLIPAADAAAMPVDHVRRAAEPAAETVVHPVAGKVGYGEWGARYGNFRRGHVHEGQDVFAPAGTPLRAVRDSVVLETGSGDGRGHYVTLYSRKQRETYVYFHLVAPATVAPGDKVRAGRRIGRVGCTGSCSGDHLHFEIRKGRGASGDSRDPLAFLRKLRS